LPQGCQSAFEFKFKLIFLREATFPADSVPLKALVSEYITWLDMDLSYRNFDQEMAAFDQLFTRPSGLFLVAESDGEMAGCVGLLRHDAGTAEVKRLYVRPKFRGLQLGKLLVDSLIQHASQLGYVRLILDAVPQTVVAQHLYRSIGFQHIEPYYPNPVSGTHFFALALTARASFSQN
jgi:putative acetyltransferase